MRVIVDGREVEVASGASVLEAVRAAGRDVPSLCWDPRTSPGGSCRTCLVAVNGDHVVAACTIPAVHSQPVTHSRVPHSPAMNPPDAIWSLAVAAEILDCSEPTIRRLVARGNSSIRHRCRDRP
jgi:hypothetical protein